MADKLDYHNRTEMEAGLAKIERIELPRNIRTFADALEHVFGCSDETARKYKREHGLELAYTRARDAFADHQILIAQDDLMDDEKVMSRTDDNGRIDPAWVAILSKRFEGLLKKKFGNKLEIEQTNFDGGKRELVIGAPDEADDTPSAV
jgi:hypothetical protein